MKYFGNTVSTIGALLVMSAMIGHMAIGFINAFSIWGWWVLLLIPFFPLVILGYPFIFWFVTGSGELFVIWGILMGCAVLGAIIASTGEKLQEKPTMTKSEPKVSKAEIIAELMEIYRSDITRRMIRNGHLLGPPSLENNPFNPTDRDILSRHMLSGNVLGIASNSELLEGILRKLLQDDYDRYLIVAEKQAVANKR